MKTKNQQAFYLQAIMKKAWTIARAGVSRHGGSVRDYLAAALRDAWTEIKASKWAKGTADLLAIVAANPMKKTYGLRSMEGSCHWIGR